MFSVPFLNIINPPFERRLMQEGHFICAKSRPDRSHDFDGWIIMWRVCIMNKAQTNTVRRVRGDTYDADVTIDSKWCRDWYVDDVLPDFREILHWLQGDDAIAQQDRGDSHTGGGT